MQLGEDFLRYAKAAFNLVRRSGTWTSHAYSTPLAGTQWIVETWTHLFLSVSSASLARRSFSREGSFASTCCPTRLTCGPHNAIAFP